MDSFKTQTYKQYLVNEFEFISDVKILPPLTDSLYKIILTHIFNGFEFYYIYEVQNLEDIKNTSFFDDINLTMYLYDKMFINIDSTIFNPNFFLNIYIGKYLFNTNDNRRIPHLAYSERLKSITNNPKINNLEKLKLTLSTKTPLFNSEEINLNYTNYTKPKYNPCLREEIEL